MIVDWPTSGKFHNMAGTTSACYAGESLPCLNYSRPLRPKLNTWYQPTGASRWGYGLFLCTLTQLNSITSQFSSSVPNSGAQLILSYYANGINYQRGFQAWMLPAHPISVNASDPNGFWIVPLVDERFYWQSQINEFSTNNTFTWANFFNEMEPLFGNLQASFVSPNYLLANYFFLNGPGSYTKAAMVFDLMAHSVGQRLVANYQTQGRGVANNFFQGGNWRSINSTDSTDILTVNLQYQYDPGIHQAGIFSSPGFSGIAPYQITVNFRQWSNGITLPNWLDDRYSITISAVSAGYAGPVSSEFEKIFNSTALADFTTGDATPNNQTNLQNLAQQIAKDFYSYINVIEDQNVIGITQWQETGFDDYLEFDVGSWCKETETYRAKTRIHSTPYNFGSENLFHYDNSTTYDGDAFIWEFGDKIVGTLDGNLTAGGTQTISLSNSTTDSPIPGGGPYHFEVTSLGDTTGNMGDTIIAFRTGDQWVVFSGASAILRGQFLGITYCLLSGNSGTITFFSGTQGSETSTGDTASCYLRRGICLEGKTYLIASTSNGYEVINPDLIAYGSFSTPIKGGNSGTLTFYQGTIGSETSTGVTTSVFVRTGLCNTTSVYIVGYTDEGWEVLNPNGILYGQFITSGTAAVLAGTTGTITFFTGTLGSETTTGITATCAVRRGICIGTAAITPVTYKIGFTSGGFEVLDPELISHGQFSGEISESGGTFTFWMGAQGGETATTITVTAYVRNGVCAKSKTYMVGYTDNGWEILNNEIVFHGRCSSTKVGGTTATFTLYSGTQGSEVSETTTITAYIRFGVVIANKTYIIDSTDNGFEVRPDTWAIVKNLTGSDIAKAGTGTVTILSGTQGAETTTGVTITALARWGAFKNNAIGRAVVDNTTNTISFTMDSTDSC